MENSNSKKNQIEKIGTNGYTIDFGTIFEGAFENYKKIALYAGLMLLVFSILFLIVLMVGIISYFGIENVEEYANKMKHITSMKMLPLDLAIPLNASFVLVSALVSPFLAGFFKMAYCGENEEEFHVSTMFSYYKSRYFFSIFTATFLIEFISNGLTLLTEFAGLSFIGSLTNIFISFVTFLTIPMIVFGNLNTIDALKSSVLIVSKQPLVLFGLFIVSGIFMLLGIFALCIGIFFTYPFIYSMCYVIYKDIVGIDKTVEIEEVNAL